MIVITGTQRSGTSLMAKFFQKNGIDVGSNFWDNRIEGGLEHPDICNFFRAYTGDPRFPFSTYWDSIYKQRFEDFSQLKSTVGKFSYLTMLPEFVKQWNKIRGNKDLFIVMQRDINKVVTSKNSRKEFLEEDSILLNQDIPTLTANYTESLALFNRYGFRYIIVPFPIDDIKRTILEIETLTGITLSLSIWKDLFDSSKIHFK